MIKDFIGDLKGEFKGYDAKKLRADVLAGITVTAVALPLALAFGVSSGANAAAGLITAIIAGLFIGGFSGASYQISGPTGAMSAILILLAQKYGLAGIWIVGVMAGIILILAAVFKFGKLVSFLPAPVISGFTSGIAIIIAVGQLDNFFGIKTPVADSSALKLFGYFTNKFTLDWHTFLFGAVVILIMVFCPKKISSKVPSSLIGLAVATALNFFLKFDVAVIGEIPKTLLPESRLTFSAIPFNNLGAFFMPSVSVAALCMIESLLCGAVAGKMKGEKMNSDRELLSQGIGNMIIPFFGGVPSTAAIARTSVAIKAGGQTRLVSIFHSVGLLLSMFLLAPVMSKIPLSALAGVLMVTAFRMNEWADIRYIFTRKFKSAISKFLITMVATVVLDLTQAIVLGIAFAVLTFVIKISEIDINIQAVDVKKMTKKGHNHSDIAENILVAYFSGPIFFATVEKLKEKLQNLKDAEVLILSMRGVSLIDISGIQALFELNDSMKAEGKVLMLSGLQPQVLKMLERSGFDKEIGKEMLFWSAEHAILAAKGKVESGKLQVANEATV